MEAELEASSAIPGLGLAVSARAAPCATLAGDDIPGFCPCIYLGNGGYEGGSCLR